MSAIVARNLVKEYGGARAVDDVSLTVGEGEFFGFLGPNGAGKSTTIRMLCGLLRPTAGQISICGHDLFREPQSIKALIGILPEEPGLYERLTADEMLRFAGQMQGLSRSEAAARSTDLLAVMELDEAKNKLIVDYSMGMKKKVALAAALIHRPRVLFLDEPFNGIDPISVRAIRDVLRQLTDRGTTIFFTSHVMEVVERLCDRVAILRQGRIVGQGTLPELRARAGSEATLEDIFLQLVDARPAEGNVLSWL